MYNQARTCAPDPALVRRLSRRRRADRWFKACCQIMVLLAIAFLIAMLSLIAAKAQTAFSRYYYQVAIPHTALDHTLSPADIRHVSTQIETTLQSGLGLQSENPEPPEISRQVFSRLALITALKALERQDDVSASPAKLGISVHHDIDWYLKHRHDPPMLKLEARLQAQGDGLYGLKLTDGDQAAALEAHLYNKAGMVLIKLGLQWFAYTGRADNTFGLRLFSGLQQLLQSDWEHIQIYTPGVSAPGHQITRRQIVIAETLLDQGHIVRRFNRDLFVQADSTLPEIAGAAAAIIGSLLTLLVTCLVALPIGICAALYLEELAPSNRLTYWLEININNLAAIPSILFGLLGAAVFLNIFGMPRSVPLVAGLVLGLLILPTVIIATRAALAAVSQDQRDAALALGASRMQTVFHHILPVAGPGIITGAILAMARAIGETAPLLLVGMVAFIHEVPNQIDDEATVLPVLIYKWFGNAERAWEPMTAAIVLILLALLLVLNAIATVIRWRIDRSWMRS